jgi:hypothetical protein
LLCFRLVLVKNWHAYVSVMPLPQPATAQSSIRSIQCSNLPPPKQRPPHSAFAPTCHCPSSIRATAGGQLQHAAGPHPLSLPPHACGRPVIARTHDQPDHRWGLDTWGGVVVQSPPHTHTLTHVAHECAEASLPHPLPLQKIHTSTPTVRRKASRSEPNSLRASTATGPSPATGARPPWPALPPSWPADRLAVRTDFSR